MQVRTKDGSKTERTIKKNQKTKKNTKKKHVPLFPSTHPHSSASHHHFHGSPNLSRSKVSVPDAEVSGSLHTPTRASAWW